MYMKEGLGQRCGMDLSAEPLIFCFSWDNGWRITIDISTQDQLEQMQHQAIINSLSFQLSFFQVSCNLHHENLKITIGTLPELPDTNGLAMRKMEVQGSQIHLEVSAFPVDQRPYQTSQSQSVASESKQRRERGEEQKRQEREKVYEVQEQQRFLVEDKISQLQQLYSTLDRKMHDIHEDNLRLTSLLQENIQNNSLNKKKQQKQQRRLFESVSGERLKSSQEKNSEMKLQMLNAMLQEKLLEKEGSIVDLEKKLFERDELVRELAEKLMVANAQKEELFVEYDKILQCTIYNHSWEGERMIEEGERRMEEGARREGRKGLQIKSQIKSSQKLVNGAEKEQSEQQQNTVRNQVKEVLGKGGEKGQGDAMKIMLEQSRDQAEPDKQKASSEATPPGLMDPPELPQDD